MKNLSQTHRYRSDPRRKEEQKVKNNALLQECFSCEYCSCLPALFLSATPVLLHFTLLLFLLQFLVFLLSTLVVITYVWIVWYFTWFVRLYKPFVYTVKGRFFAVNKIRTPVLPFFSFSLIFSPFIGCQTPSKDDNLEDERIKPLPP